MLVRVSDRAPYRELTPAALIGGILVGALLNMGIVFAGMQIGFTIVGSTVAAVLGFGILRGLLRKGSILEVNVFQTVASSVNTVNAGIIFTVPVLFLLGFEERIDYGSLILATTAGSLMGVAIINIGFNSDVAWTHTVSNAPRFTGALLQLEEGNPTRYLYDGAYEDMTTRTFSVQVAQSDGALEEVTRTLYSSRWGPVKPVSVN